MAPSELRAYRYAPLLDSNSLPVLALRPAHEGEEEIDCEIVNIPLPDKCTEMAKSRDRFAEELQDIYLIQSWSMHEASMPWAYKAILSGTHPEDIVSPVCGRLG
jgi:hypothetical protein